MSTRIETWITPQFVELATDLDAMTDRIETQLAFIDTMHEHYRETPDEAHRAHVGRALQRGSEYLRLAGEVDQSVELKQACREIWLSLDRQKAVFLVDLQGVQLMLQASRVEEARIEAQRLFEMQQQDGALDPYKAFVQEALGCAMAAEGSLEQASGMFQDMKQSLPESSPLQVRVAMYLEQVNAKRV